VDHGSDDALGMSNMRAVLPKNEATRVCMLIYVKQAEPMDNKLAGMPRNSTW
jgi:hypothetical protein